MKQFILFAVIVISMYACVSIHNNFTYYKEKPFINNSSAVYLNGIYFIRSSKNKIPAGFMYLYTDGSVYISNLGGLNIDSMFWSNPNQYLSFLENKWPSIKQTENNSWGSYKIRNDSISIQYFSLNYDYWMKRNSIELEGIIKNDSTILIYKEICNWCHTLHPSYYNASGINNFVPIAEYGFYPSLFKPDSTKAWYKQQSWYKKWQEEQNKQAR